jgi:hypothetical protein
VGVPLGSLPQAALLGGVESKPNILVAAGGISDVKIFVA